MEVLYNNRSVIGNFNGASNDHSSSETNSGSPVVLNFSTGEKNNGPNKGSNLPIRCLRKGPAPRCANPYGLEGSVLYNTTHNVLQFCDGARWIAIGKTGP
jgi:hypothetical protein